MPCLPNNTDRETEKRITIVLLVAFSIDVIGLIILAIHIAVLIDGTISICTVQEYLAYETS